jgi:hypothetical protein
MSKIVLYSLGHFFAQILTVFHMLQNGCSWRRDELIKQNDSIVRTGQGNKVPWIVHQHTDTQLAYYTVLPYSIRIIFWLEMTINMKVSLYIHLDFQIWLLTLYMHFDFQIWFSEAITILNRDNTAFKFWLCTLDFFFLELPKNYIKQ